MNKAKKINTETEEEINEILDFNEKEKFSLENLFYKKSLKRFETRNDKFQKTIEDIHKNLENYIFTDYFGDQITKKEYEKIPSENTEICEKILNDKSVNNADINSLTYLPLKVATALVKQGRRSIFLNNLHTLSKSLAKVLEKFKGVELHLNGLEEIDTEAVNELKLKFQGVELYLRGIKITYLTYIDR